MANKKKPSTIQSKNRSRGINNERDLVHKLQDNFNIEAKRVPLSGSIPGLGGDVELEGLSTLLEAKVIAVEQTVRGSRYMRLDLDWVDKNERHAKSRGFRHAAVVVRGCNLSKRYVIIDFEEYINLLKTRPLDT
jgi:hypothetical protein